MREQLGMVIARPTNFALLDRFELRRAEFVVFPRSERDNLIAEIRRRDLEFSAHCPIFRDPEFPENPLLACLADADPDRRARSIRLARENIEEAASLGADHLVVHLQRPAHFSGDDPGVTNDGELLDAALSACEDLAAVSQSAGVPVLLENLMDNPHFNRPEPYVTLLEKFPQFGFCLDIGHLDVDARSFGIDFMEFIHALAPFTRAIHLQNSRGGGDNFEGRYWKMPVHPSQSPEEGWRDIPAILRIVLNRNPQCVVNFESVPTDIEYAAEGVRWVRGLLNAWNASATQH